MKTTIETDAEHIMEDILKAGYAQDQRLHVTVEPSKPKRTPREIAERAHRVSPLRGISEEILGHAREFRENFTIERSSGS